MPISPQLLEILACPRCLNGVRLNKTGDGLICDTCHLVYEIRDDIPIMLISEALKLFVDPNQTAREETS
ncbi:MAG: Trm112 family protein [Deltaproteobacteria bacterium]|nr:Trm112 family protein [Deltaproteobacteria bacterium]